MTRINLAMMLGLLIILLSGCGSDRQALETLSEEGYNLYQQGNFKEAIEVFSKGIATDPAYVDFYTNRGMAYYESGDVAAALEDLNKAITLETYTPEAYVNRGTVYLGNGDYEKALKDFYKAIDQKDHFYQELGLYYAYLNLGALLNEVHRYDEALAVFEKAEKEHAEDPALYNAMGLLYRNTGALDKSIEAYNKALDLNQYYAYAYGNRAASFVLKGERAIALSDINTAIDLDKYVPQFYALKARIHLADKDYDMVEKTVSAGLAIWAPYGELYMIRGNMYMAQEAYTKALMQYGQAVQFGSTEGLLGQAIGYRMIEDYDSALTVVEKYLKEQPENLQALTEKGLNLKMKGSYEAAIEVFEQALTISEEAVEAKFYMATAYEGLADYDKAKALLKEIIEDNPNHDKAKEELAFLEKHYKP